MIPRPKSHDGRSTDELLTVLESKPLAGRLHPANNHPTHYDRATVVIKSSSIDSQHSALARKTFKIGTTKDQAKER